MATANEAKHKEIWKSPPSLNCQRVEVSNLGRVRTLPYLRTFFRLGVPRTNKCRGKILHGGRDSRGRRFLGGGTFKKSLYGKGFLVHRLVAECFVPNPKPKEYDMVFFKDGDVENCKASNLEWGCRKDRDLMSRGTLTLYKIYVISNGKKIGPYCGCKEVGRALGCSKQAVHFAIMNGTLCKGYELVAMKGDGDKPYHSLEEARKANCCKPKSKGFLIPDSIYSKQDIEIPMEAVFK